MRISGEQRRGALALWEELKFIDAEIKAESVRVIEGEVQRFKVGWDFRTGPEAVGLVEELHKLHAPLEKLPLPEGDGPWLRLLETSEAFLKERTEESHARFARALQAFQEWLAETYDLDGELTGIGKRMQVDEQAESIVLDGTSYSCKAKKAINMLAILLQREKIRERPISAKDLGTQAWGRSVSDGTARKMLKRLPAKIYACLDKKRGGGHSLSLPTAKK